MSVPFDEVSSRSFGHSGMVVARGTRNRQSDDDEDGSSQSCSHSEDNEEKFIIKDGVK